MSRSFVGSSNTTRFAGRGEEASEQEPVALTAGEHLYWGFRALGGEQEVVEITRDVFALGADLDPVGTGTDGLRDGRLRVQLRAQLVEVGDLEVGAQLHRAGVRFQRAENERMRVDLPAPLAPMRPIRSPRMMRADRLRTTVRSPKLLLTSVSSATRAPERSPESTDLHIAEAVEPLSAIDPQPLESLHTPFIARAPCLHALADPDFLLRPEFVETGGDSLLPPPVPGPCAPHRPRSYPGRNAGSRDRARGSGS